MLMLYRWIFVRAMLRAMVSLMIATAAPSFILRVRDTARIRRMPWPKFVA